jgi:hypothetical protein
LKDGKPSAFPQILSKVGFFHNTLRMHTAQLEEKGLVAKRNRNREGPVRHRFTYSLPKGVDGRIVSAL